MAGSVPANNPWYVILGEGGARKTQQEPPMLGRKFTSTFPIIVKVYTEAQADEVLTYNASLQKIIEEDDLLKKVKLAFSLQGARLILRDFVDTDRSARGFFPVVWGQKCGIFLSHEECRNAVGTATKPIYHHALNWGLAIAYMISKGETEKTNRNDFALLAEEYKGRLQRMYPRSPPPSPSTPSRSPRAAFTASPPASPSPSPSPSSARPSTLAAQRPASTSAPVRPSASARSTTAAPVSVVSAHPSASPLPSASTPTRPPAHAPSHPPTSTSSRPSAPIPTIPSGTSTRTHLPPSDPFASPLYREAIFAVDTVHSLGDPSIVYQHVRSLQGVEKSVAYPLINTIPVPSCGPALDLYLQAMGYDVEAKLAITFAIGQAGEMVDFVRAIVPKGVLVLEAKYMWILHSLETPKTEWAECHLM